MFYNLKADSQEEDHDGRWRLYLPHRSCTGSASVLQTLMADTTAHGRSSLSRIPDAQGASAAS